MSEIIFIISLTLINIIFIMNFEFISNLIGIFDNPDNKRKIHKFKIPSIGGILIFFNITYLLTFNFLFGEKLISKNFFEIDFITLFYFYITLLIIFIMGLLDDSYELNPFLKILILISVIYFLISFDQSLEINYLRFFLTDQVYDISSFSTIFTLSCIVVFMNAFNMYDGTNLQVSSISIVIFFYLLFLLNGKSYFLITLIICLISFSFLNYKNKLFLGDNGSLILSFVISYLFIKLYNKEVIYYAENVCLFLLLPVLDLLRLFMVRILHKKSPFKPDKNHLHHILMTKFSYNSTMLILFGIYFIPVFFGILIKEYPIFIFIQIILYLAILKFSKEKI